ncbi:ABC transporter ATP-binding protein [Bradyrhizobium sp. HKCCYLR20261]|uniref:ABC transporter ATP-binding protein n=1 Tax=Bradyrhizobium sp. HKCCYLR20261 TaxID=3420760 RepID=UPI003EBD2DAF
MALLEVTGLVRRFGALRAVDGLALSVDAGQIHALIGPNGAGKTTAFNCISGFLAPSAGRIALDGNDVTGWPAHRLVAAGLARTFQVTKVFDEMSVRENVALGVRSRLRLNRRVWPGGAAASIVARSCDEILDTVGLGARADSAASALSHGERRVLEIAISLAVAPKLLMLDEPTAGMSAGDSGLIGRLVRRLARTTAVLLVEHDIDLVLGLSDRITVMAQGRAIATGTPEVVSRDAAVQEAYLGRSGGHAC